MHPVNDPTETWVTFLAGSRTWIVCGSLAGLGDPVAGLEDGVAGALGDGFVLGTWLALGGCLTLGTGLVVGWGALLPITLADGLAVALALLQAASASATVDRQTRAARARVALVAESAHALLIGRL